MISTIQRVALFCVDQWTSRKNHEDIEEMAKDVQRSSDGSAHLPFYPIFMVPSFTCRTANAKTTACQHPYCKRSTNPTLGILGWILKKQSYFIFKDRQKHDYDRHHASRDPPSVPNDSDVWITSGDQPVADKAASRASTPRSYIINTPILHHQHPNGQIRRNCQHLNRVPENHTPIAPSPHPTRDPIMTRSRTETIKHSPNRL